MTELSAKIPRETAGAGAAAGREGGAVLNRGVLEGVGDAPGIRDRILQRLRRSRSAGLGDEPRERERDRRRERRGAGSREHGRTEGHVAVLREIRDAVREL